MHRLFLLAALALATPLAACGAKDPTAVTLALAPAKITIVQADGARHELTLAADGTVAYDGIAFALISKNGRLRAGDAVSWQLVKDGTVLVRGSVSNVGVRDDSFILDGETALTIGDDNALTGPLLVDLDHPAFVAAGATLRYEGPRESRTTILLGLAALLTSGPELLGGPVARPSPVGSSPDGSPTQDASLPGAP